MSQIQYADLAKMQLVRVVGTTLHDNNAIIVTVRNTMDNLNLTYSVPLSEFVSERFVDNNHPFLCG